MKAVVVEEVGDAGVLRLKDLPSPTPGPGEIVVDVAAAGVNFIDVYHRTGLYPPPAPLPFVPGGEGSGTVTAVGPAVTHVRVGERVAWCQVPGGGYAEQIVLSEGDAIPIGDDLDDDVAAAVLVQGLTAHYLTKSVYPVGPGDTALVHAAAGGTGYMITQTVKLLGGTVIAAVSTPEKEAVAREAGADHVVNYGKADFVEEARRLTDGQGVSVVYDGTGASTFEGSMASLRRRGTMVLYGASSGPVPPVDVQRVLRGGVFLTRPSMPDYISTREDRLPPIGEVLGWLREGRLKVRIGGRYPLDDAGRAHRDLESRATVGKLLLLPG